MHHAHKPRVLIIEDEAHLAAGICDNLIAEGYDVVIAHDGEEGIVCFKKQHVDLIVLDVMLPKRDGFMVCDAIRCAGGRQPILFLTAKNSSDDRIRGLEAGGDDYLGKPFDLRELLLRINAMLRRQAWYSTQTTLRDVYQLAGHTIRFSTYEVTNSLGQVEFLSQKEMMILKVLIDNAGNVVSRDTLLDVVWGYDVYPSSRTLDNLIMRLRKRFEPDPMQPYYIHTMRGIGYYFSAKPESVSQHE